MTSLKRCAGIFFGPLLSIRSAAAIARHSRSMHASCEDGAAAPLLPLCVAAPLHTTRMNTGVHHRQHPSGAVSSSQGAGGRCGSGKAILGRWVQG